MQEKLLKNLTKKDLINSMNAHDIIKKHRKLMSNKRDTRIVYNVANKTATRKKGECGYKSK